MYYGAESSSHLAYLSNFGGFVIDRRALRPLCISIIIMLVGAVCCCALISLIFFEKIEIGPKTKEAKSTVIDL